MQIGRVKVSVYFLMSEMEPLILGSGDLVQQNIK
jgi:hypothetical protein